MVSLVHSQLDPDIYSISSNRSKRPEPCQPGVFVVLHCGSSSVNLLTVFRQEAAELFVKDKKSYERRVRRIAEESLAST